MDIDAPDAVPAADPEPWLLVVDPQRIFAELGSEWGSPFFPAAMENIARLAGPTSPRSRRCPTAPRSR